MKQLLQHEFFAEDTGFKLEILDKEMVVESDQKVINFRLKITDQRKQRREKPAHKENEAIEFEFNLEQDDCNELASNMVNITFCSCCKHLTTFNVCRSQMEFS